MSEITKAQMEKEEYRMGQCNYCLVKYWELDSKEAGVSFELRPVERTTKIQVIVDGKYIGTVYELPEKCTC
jgi:hypothetical protein